MRVRDTLRLLFGSLIFVAILMLQRDSLRKHNLSATSYKPSNKKCPIDSNLATMKTYFQIQPEEANFPLAFNILVFTDLDRAIRLLRAIYRPQNSYCIHVDKKCTENYTKPLETAASCLGSNIFFVPDSERRDARWGKISNLEPELVCFKIHIESGRDWKYLINLTGQEFPLRTNWELVAALKALNGSNVVAATYKHRNRWRIPPKRYLDFNVTYYKGSIHVALRREFVIFTLFDGRSLKLMKALRDYEKDMGRGVHVGETYFSTLNHNPHIFPIPGAFLGEHEVETLAREKIWRSSGATCGSGKWVRTICMFGIADLPLLLRSEKFFANKFRVHIDPEAYDILEQWIESKVKYEAEHGRLHPSFNSNVYAMNELAWNHL